MTFPSIMNSGDPSYGAIRSVSGPEPTLVKSRLAVAGSGVPFSMTLPKQEYRADRAIRAVKSLSEAAQQNGTADMSLDEINAEIAASRADRASRNARNGA